MYTPEKIIELNENEVFVFGSNEAGIHGKGAAKMAMKWGAIYGEPEGIQGKTYAIPTKDKYIKNKLSLEKIKQYVDKFIIFAKCNPLLTFLVTKIGCGLAGHKQEDIAPLFSNTIRLENVILPESFYEIIKKEN